MQQLGTVHYSNMYYRFATLPCVSVIFKLHHLILVCDSFLYVTHQHF